MSMLLLETESFQEIFGRSPLVHAKKRKAIIISAFMLQEKPAKNLEVHKFPGSIRVPDFFFFV